MAGCTQRETLFIVTNGTLGDKCGRWSVGIRKLTGRLMEYDATNTSNYGVRQTEANGYTTGKLSKIQPDKY